MSALPGKVNEAVDVKGGGIEDLGDNDGGGELSLEGLGEEAIEALRLALSTLSTDILDILLKLVRDSDRDVEAVNDDGA